MRIKLLALIFTLGMVTNALAWTCAYNHPTSPNLALGKVVSTSSNASGKQGSLVVDNNLESWWESSGIPAWVMIDLGAVKPVKWVDLGLPLDDPKFNGDGGVHITLEFSQSPNGPWIRPFGNGQYYVTNKSNGNGQAFDLTTISQNARYVKITISGQFRTINGVYVPWSKAAIGEVAIF